MIAPIINLNLPVYVVEEADQVDGQLDPTLAHIPGQCVRFQDRGGIIQSRSRHHRAVFVAAIYGSGLNKRDSIKRSYKGVLIVSEHQLKYISNLNE